MGSVWAAEGLWEREGGLEDWVSYGTAELAIAPSTPVAQQL